MFLTVCLLCVILISILFCTCICKYKNFASGLDSLPCYQVTVENQNVKVRARRTDLEKNKRIKTMAKRDPNDSRTFVVVGGGPSGGICAETLRQQGYQGRLVLVNKESYLPYDRVKVHLVLSGKFIANVCCQMKPC